MDATFLSTMCDDILQACKDAYRNVASSPAAPASMFVTHGTPVADGEQLTVVARGVRVTNPFPRTQISELRAAAVTAADVSIEVWRSCWPTMTATSATVTAPTAADLTAAARMLLEDAATLWGYVASLAANGKLCPSLPTLTIGDFALQPLVPLEPQGGLAGWRWPLIVKLAIP